MTYFVFGDNFLPSHPLLSMLTCDLLFGFKTQRLSTEVVCVATVVRVMRYATFCFLRSGIPLALLWPMLPSVCGGTAAATNIIAVGQSAIGYLRCSLFLLCSPIKHCLILYAYIFLSHSRYKVKERKMLHEFYQHCQ